MIDKSFLKMRVSRRFERVLSNKTKEKKLSKLLKSINDCTDQSYSIYDIMVHRVCKDDKMMRKKAGR